MENPPETPQSEPNFLERALARARAMRVLGNFVAAAQAFSEDRCSLIAAALSYYTLLAIFPLLLFLVTLASYFLQSENATRTVVQFFNEFLPQSSNVIRTNLNQLTQSRGAVTLAAAAGLWWTASGVFNTVQLGLNRAFRAPRARPLWRERLVSMAMVVSVGVLFGVSFLLTTTFRLSPSLRVLRNALATEVISILIAIHLAALVFGVLYRYVPYDPTIRWRDVLFPAFLAAALWEIAKLGFVWYLTNVNQVSLVYGSIGAVIALMLWSYVTWVIVLYCAELGAMRMGARQRPVTGREWWSIAAGDK